METYFVTMMTCLLLVSSLTATAAGSGEQPINVTSILESPYLMEVGESDNVRFEGYIVDLLNSLANKAGFSYIIKLVIDKKYGTRLDNGRWNGMIGEVNQGDADMAAAPITVSDERREAVDFTVPFMTFGSAILMKKPRLASNETTPINSISDLSRQTAIKYGVVMDGRTAAFFRTSQDPAYKLMWDEMSKNPDYGTVPDTREGVRKVRQSDGRYAFILEGTTASYWVHRKPCNLVSVEGRMDRREYALAVRHGSELKRKLDEALTEMKDDGVLDRLHHKWWIAKSECNGAASFIAATSLLSTLFTVLSAAAFPLL